MKSSKKLGLALGSGGLLGVAHIGVLEVLEENDIKPQLITGTSVGSLVAALYASGVSPVRMHRLALNLRKEDLFSSNLSFPVLLLLLLQAFFDLVHLLHFLPRGFLNNQRMGRYAEKVSGGNKIDEKILPVGVVSADLISGKEVVFTNAALPKKESEMIILGNAPLGIAVRASSAIPGIFEPIPYRGLLLADGGLIEALPAFLARSLGAEVVVAVNLSHEQQAVEPTSLVQVSLKSLSIFAAKQLKQNAAAADLIISPNVGNVGLSDFEHVPELLEAGRKAALEVLPKLQKLIK